MSTKPLINRYRPEDFDEVVGHDLVLRGLQRAISQAGPPKSYLFTGVAGLGKTTLARIVAKALECEPVEIDAASNSGVDDMRNLVELGNHVSITGAGRRMFIIDECHALSKPAWQAILKMLEEPPDHLFLALCTTELQKVPETIQTRCYHTQLKPIPPGDLEQLLTAVAEAEGWDVDNDVMATVVQAATGQPRKALSMLEAVHDVGSREEVKRVLSLIDDSDPVFELCKLVMAGKGWDLVQKQMARVDPDSFQQAPVLLGRFLTGAMERAKSDKEAHRAWTMLDALLFPSSSHDPKANFFAALGRIYWGKE